MRILARAEWRAGLGDARCVQRMALERLRHAAVPPQRKLLETCVYLHAKQGDFPASLALLNDPFCAREQMRSEGPYLALISAITQPDDVDYVSQHFGRWSPAVSSRRCAQGLPSPGWLRG